jgi:hypothetical protein
MIAGVHPWNLQSEFSDCVGKRARNNVAGEGEPGWDDAGPWCYFYFSAKSGKLGGLLIRALPRPGKDCGLRSVRQKKGCGERLVTFPGRARTK